MTINNSAGQKDRASHEAQAIGRHMDIGRSMSAALKKLRVACILDEFTHNCFKHECDLRQVSLSSWRNEFEKFAPDFFFFESAWNGVDGSWHGILSYGKPEFIELLDYCRNKMIPTVFWSKEDPVHFQRFLSVAKLADHIFTTDIDCLNGYKREAGHDRVYLLTFAAQPKDHNPIEKYSRRDAFCFAGSYYNHYADRVKDFKELINTIVKYKPVEIYDRNLDRPKPHAFEFPDEYKSLIVGTLPVENIDMAYKGYRYAVNINTITQSQTMFARRIFELLASNTPIVSNYSLGLRMTFGDLVISSSEGKEIARRLTEIVENETKYRKFRLAGLRKVFCEHTYEDRFGRICSKLSGLRVAGWEPSVCVVAYPQSSGEAHRILDSFRAQSYTNKRLCLINDGQYDFDVVEFQTSTTASSISMLAEAQWVAPFCADDYYGPNYLIDLMTAVRYTTATAIVKSTYYRYKGKRAWLTNSGAQYSFVREGALRSAVIESDRYLELVVQTPKDIAATAVSGEGIFSVDEFNYLKNGATAPKEAKDEVGDIPNLFGGFVMDDLLENYADISTTVSEKHKEIDTANMPCIGPDEFVREIGHDQLQNSISMSLAGNVVNIKSKLESDKYKYIYMKKQYTLHELNLANSGVVQLNIATEVNILGIFIYNDINNKKIKHHMFQLNRPQRLHVPTGTDTVKVGLRIQGSGEAVLDRLFLCDPKQENKILIPRSASLLITSQYQSYEDLYKYGFLHSRVRAYRESGVLVDVFQERNNTAGIYREFENIDIMQADLSTLEHVLETKKYRNLLVHVMTLPKWEVISKHIENYKLIIWIHGAEIQPWYRRAFCNKTDEAVARARTDGDVRRSMWKEIFALNHPNIKFVFISKYQYHEVVNDYGLSLSSESYEIIPNHVSESLFQYKKKDVEKRKKILSIRPFASEVYANDLTVAAIEALSTEPWFNELEFRIIGDGILFDEITAPLRKYQNVHIDRGFITQQQIAQLHKEFGVFLVPSRMDTQGVARDEAMHSGLVPITTRVAAIPEFVNENCAMLADPEDHVGLANAIRKLYREPDLFLRLSSNAAAHSRTMTNRKNTIDKELRLLTQWDAATRDGAQESWPLGRVAIYGDLSLNITDGSAIWAVSLTETLTKIEGLHVTLYLKTRVTSTHIIEPLLNLSDRLRIVEPDLPLGKVLKTEEAIKIIETDDIEGKNYRGVIMRGLKLCTLAARSRQLAGKLIPYLTDIPQQPENITPQIRQILGQIISNSSRLLCQTTQFEQYFKRNFPEADGKTAILTPMIPDFKMAASRPRPANLPLRIVYAGKFAPLWGVREMFDSFDNLRNAGLNVGLDVFGDKIHNPPEDQTFHSEIVGRLNGGKGVKWHGAVSRNTLMRELPFCDVAWAYRNAKLEDHTLELSTKLLEYASCGVPMILAPNAINNDLLGRDYPLFVKSAEEAEAKIAQIIRDPGLLQKAAKQVLRCADSFTFKNVAKKLEDQGLFI